MLKFITPNFENSINNMKYSFFIVSILFFQCCRSQPTEKLKSNTDNNTLLWEISGKGLKNPSYLFGTFHMMCKEDIHLSDNLRQAVNSSAEIYFEMDLDDPSNTLGALLFLNMKEGKTLKDLYTPEEYTRVEKFFKDSLHMGMGMFQKMKPNFLEAMLYPKLMPCKTMSGMEMEIMELAKDNKEKKEIKGFETIAFQASVFDSVPYKDQAKELLKTIDSIAAFAHYFDTLLSIYKTQQISSIEKMFNDPNFNMDEKNQDILLNKRNKNWVEQLKKILPGKNIFIAVGAGHLVGKNGVIELLKKEGYILRPIVNK